MPSPAPRRIFTRLACLSLMLALFSAPVARALDELPTLGDTTARIVSPEKERRLGQAWLRAFRGQVPLAADALLQEYSENLIFRLAGASELKDHRLSVVLVHHDSINAFAVPGGVVGIHTGLILAAHSRDEFASVLAHELAHLSQRHFARRVEDMNKAKVPTLAGMLTGMVLAATVGGDAGMAVMSATQAASLQRMLNFSRENEQEADRLGIQTLVRAGMDPHAFPSMFERMIAAYRFAGERPPEFLLTHPLTESRLADTRNRAAQYPSIGAYEDDPEYHIMRVRAQLSFEDPTVAVKRYRGELDENQTRSAAASRYGLALALGRAGRVDEARAALQPLLDKHPNRISYVIAQAEILLKGDRFDEAEKLLRRHLDLNPGNFPLMVTYASAATRNNNPEPAEDILREMARRRPDDPLVYKMLAEAHGKAKNIVGVHLARAEYLFQTGDLDGALEQLRYGQRLTKNQYQLHERIRLRMAMLESTRNDLRF